MTHRRVIVDIPNFQKSEMGPPIRQTESYLPHDIEGLKKNKCWVVADNLGGVPYGMMMLFENNATTNSNEAPSAVLDKVL